MAGTHIQLELDSKAVRRVLDRAARELEGEGKTLMLQDMGEYLLRATRDRAAGEHGPDGKPWPALSPRYAKRKQRKRGHAPMLVYDRHLLGDRLAWQVHGDTLYIGTSAKYGAIQQFGGRGIPARPWLGVSEEDAGELVDIARHHLRRALDE